MTFQARIEGTPVPLERVRSRTGQIQPYDTKRNKDMKRLIAAACQRAGFRPFPAGQPVALALTFAFRHPLRHHVASKRSNPLRDDVPRFHTGIPDADNLVKLVKDALPHVAFHNDSQVCWLDVRKVYDLHPYTLIAAWTFS